jgi:hypothetical protein
MPSIMVSDSTEMAAFIIPLTREDAKTITETVTKREIGDPGNGRGYFATYGPDMYGNPCKMGLWVTPILENGRWMFHLIAEEYRPRKDGKAEVEFGKAKAAAAKLEKSSYFDH